MSTHVEGSLRAITRHGHAGYRGEDEVGRMGRGSQGLPCHCAPGVQSGGRLAARGSVVQPRLHCGVGWLHSSRWGKLESGGKEHSHDTFPSLGPSSPPTVRHGGLEGIPPPIAQLTCAGRGGTGGFSEARRPPGMLGW